jgi:lambda family phage portal protein
MNSDHQIILASQAAEDRRMKTAQRIARAWCVNPNSSRATRSAAYQGASVNRLTEDWPVSILSADAATRWNLRQLRARSRDLERNGGIQERYLSAVEANVVGSYGVRLQMKAKRADARTNSGLTAGLDDAANQLIEQDWIEFGRRGNYDVTGKHSRNDFWRLSLRTAARDGDALVLVYRGANVPNKWKIAFQLLEGDYLDDTWNVDRLPSGNLIRMGVELDQFRRKVAFWIFAKHPGDYGVEGVYTYDGRRLRIPAYDPNSPAPVSAIHLGRTKRSEETRPVPDITPVMMAIKMLEGYEEAELVASRAQACKHVFYERDLFNSQGDQLFDNEDASGNLVDDMEPGGATELPAGYKANFFNPTHPNQAFPEFVKSMKRKISAGLNCAYNTLFVDLESVNYSSIRAGLLDEREMWKMRQSWLGDDLVQPSFDCFLQMGLMLGLWPGLGMTDYIRVRDGAIWKFRRWDWVDPFKDVRASVEALGAKITTRAQVIADRDGGDFEDVIVEYGREQDFMRAHGVDPAPIATVAEQIIDPNVGDNTDPNPNNQSRPAAPTGPPQRKAIEPAVPQALNLVIDAKAASNRRKGKITRPDGTIAQFDFEYE